MKRNYLTHLNADLAGRISEVSVYWNESDLKKVVEKGRLHLNIVIAPDITNRIVNDSFGNVGLLQNLVLETLDHSQIFEKKDTPQVCEKQEFFESAALSYAEQLEAVYLEFSRRVSKGIRKRKGSTKIYAYAMQACFEASDEELINGVEFGTIYRRANERQPRVQQGNLKSILRKIDGLQIDDRGKGLILTYAENSDSVAVVDRSVLFYRKYCTVHWPWTDIINEAATEEDGFDTDNHEAT